MDGYNLKDLTQYIVNKQGYCQGELGKLQKKSMDDKIPIIPPETVSFLETVLTATKPCKILEIGCAVGFSASLMSGFLKEGGKIITIERNPVMAEKAKINFAKLNLQDKITLIEGDANEILKRLDEKFDFVFMDAGKGQYINIINDCLRLLKIGGLIFADDIFQNGNLILERSEVIRRQRTIHKRMNNFIDLMTNSKALKSSLIPIGDGVLLSCKIQEVEFKIDEVNILE